MQREVTDKENTTWTCVQAYSGGLNGDKAETAAMAEKANGKVTVVCTPGGGAQTVRLELAKDWPDSLSDAELTNQITSAQEEV